MAAATAPAQSRAIVVDGAPEGERHVHVAIRTENSGFTKDYVTARVILAKRSTGGRLPPPAEGAGLIRDNGLVSSLNRGIFHACRDDEGSLVGVALLGHVTMVETEDTEALRLLSQLAQQHQRTRAAAACISVSHRLQHRPDLTPA